MLAGKQPERQKEGEQNQKTAGEQVARMTMLPQTGGHPVWYAVCSSGQEQTFKEKVQKGQDRHRV